MNANQETLKTTIAKLSRSITTRRIGIPWGAANLSSKIRENAPARIATRNVAGGRPFAGKIFFTANEGAALRLSALISANAPNIANLRNDEWYVIAPIGEFLSPDGTYTQILSSDQAQKIVKTWNSISGKAARMFKNVMHGLGAKFSTPVFDGHPETNKDRWPIARLLAETTDLRATENALEGKLTWNEKGMARRTQGPLYPSPLWWHEPPNDERKVFPELLESIGLVPTPNIASVPAWTQNASPEAETQTTNENIMDRKKLIEKLGLGADATDDQILSAIEDRNRTANSAVDRKKLIEILGLGADATNEQIIEKVTGVRTTANAAPDRSKIISVLTLGQDATNDQIVAALTNLQNEKGVLSTANGILVDGVLDAFELAGKIKPADRAGIKAKFTANLADSATVITDLKTKKAEMNTQHLEINGNRIDISTANARKTVIDSAVAKLMREEKLEYNEAYARVQADPQYAQVFGAMSDPTKKAA